MYVGLILPLQLNEARELGDGSAPCAVSLANVHHGINRAIAEQQPSLGETCLLPLEKALIPCLLVTLRRCCIAETLTLLRYDLVPNAEHGLVGNCVWRR